MKLYYRIAQALSRSINRLRSTRGKADVRDPFVEIYLERISAHLKHLRAGERGIRILDAGCGTGSIAIGLARCGYAVTGIDYHPASLQQAQREALAAEVDVKLEQGELSQALRAMDSNVYDAVVCTEVLYTCANYRELLQELNRMLKSGGFLFVSFPTRFHIVTTLLRRGSYSDAMYAATHTEGVLRMAQLPTYYNWTSREELTDDLKHAGFEVVEIGGIGRFCGKGSDGLAGIVNIDEVDGASRKLLLDLERVPMKDYEQVGRYLFVAGQRVR